MRMERGFHLLFYVLVVGSLRALLTVGARVTRVVFHQPPPGAFVMASNHISHFDPPFLSGWFPGRKLDWIAMSDLFAAGWSARAFGWLDVIPVDRNGDDRHALREAMRRLSDGRVIGVFPEGGIRDGARSVVAGAPMRGGAAMMAARAGCPIVPVVILGSERLYNLKNWLPWRRARVYIAVGAAIPPPSGDTARGAAREQMSEQLAAALIRLKDDLVARCQLQEDDLPHSPQERMAEA